MFYSADERRKIILDNFNYPTYQVELKKLTKISQDWQVPFFTFSNLEGGCGDILHLLIQVKDKQVEQIFFAGQQSCLITVSSSNILSSYLTKKNLDLGREIINNCQAMLKGEKYCLDAYPQLKVFSDMPNFPHRLECIKLVIRGITSILYS